MVNQPACVHYPSMAAGFQAHSQPTLQNALLWWKTAAQRLMQWPVLVLALAKQSVLLTLMEAAALMPATTVPLVKGHPYLVVQTNMHAFPPAM